MMKLRSRRGLTLVEALMTVMILSLISLAIATGLIVATRAQSQSIFESESGLVANTINLALSDVLRYAEYRGDISGTTNVNFSNSDYGLHINGHLTIVDGLLVYTNGTGGTPLVNDYLGLEMEDWELSYSSGVFSGSYKLTNAADDPADEIIRDFTFAFKTLITP
jgi:type II secretory pathway pseudopilin PulG